MSLCQDNCFESSEHFSLPGEEFRPFAKGCFCDCFVGGDFVLKVFVPAKVVAMRYAAIGLHLGEVSWSPAPGNLMRSAYLRRKRALESAERCCREFPALAAVLDFQIDEAASIPLLTLPRVTPARTGPWVLQRRCETYREIIENRPQSDARDSLTRMLNLVKELEARGVSARVCNFLDNWGELDGQPRFLDIGDFDFGGADTGLKAILDRLQGQDSFRELQRTCPSLFEHLSSEILAALHLSP